MDNSHLASYIEMLMDAKIEFYTLPAQDDDCDYVYSEDIDEGQIIFAKFDIDGNLINIGCDPANSLDEVINRCRCI